MRETMGSLLRRFVLVLGLLLCTSANVHAVSFGKNVNVSVRAKWEGTSLLLETGELLAKESNDLYWRFLEQWLATGESAKLRTDKECLQHIEEKGSSLLGALLSPLFRLSLSLRSASPKLVLYQQLATESLPAHNSEKRANEEAPNQVHADRWSVGKTPSASGRCCWIDTGSQILFEESEVFNWLQFSAESAGEAKDQPEVFEFDHIYPGSEYGAHTAVLYGALGTPCFERLHTLLAGASKDGFVKYVVRPVLSSGCEKVAERCAHSGYGGPVSLGGFGVELALKNMEYKAIDDSEVKKGDGGEDARTEDLSQDVRGFIFSKLLERKPELTGELMTFRDHLLSAGVADSFNVWELKDLGYQATQRIIRASEPLKLMQEINQNFPNLVSSLSRMQMNETIKEEIVANQRLLPAGKNLVSINGALLNLDTLDLFSLIELVQGELSTASNILSMKIPEKFVRKFLLLPEASEQGAMRLDYRSDKHVHYLNNIEEDSRYRRWRANLNELLMPVFPGQMRYVRKNLYHAVYVIDPATPKGLLAVEAFSLLYQNNYPLRFGVILLSGRVLEQIAASGEDILTGAGPDGVSNLEDSATDLSLLVIRLFLFMKEEYDDQELPLKFLTELHAAWAGESHGDDNVPVERSHVEDALKAVLKSKHNTAEGLQEKTAKILSKFDTESDFKEEALSSTLFVYKLGLLNVYPALLMNGQVYSSSQATNAAVQAMNDELPRIQEGVYYGHINIHTDVLGKFLTEEGQPRYNPEIVSVPKEERKHVGLAYPVAQNDPVLTRLQYLHHPGTEDDVKAVTHWLALDLTQKNGVRLLQQALQYLSDGSKKGRVGIFHNVKAEIIHEPSLLIRVVMAVANSPSRRAKAVPFLQKLLTLKEVTDVHLGKDAEGETVKIVLKLAEELGLKASALEQSISPDSAHSILEKTEEEAKFLSRLCGLKPGVDAVITNGRVFIQDDGHYFVKEDFSLLENVEYEKRVKQVEELVEKIEWNGVDSDDLTSEFLSTVIMGVSSALSARTKSSESVRFELLKAEHSAIVRKVEESPIHVDAVIDPLSATGQKLSPLLVLLQEWIKPSMRICFNPMSSLADLPLKNFYRFVLPVKDSFTSEGSLTAGPFALFSNMPPSRTLTMNLDVPEPWLVEPVVAVHDLDNIVLEKLEDTRTMHAIYELEALVLTGHCYEKDTKEPPRGLQLLLGTKDQPHMVDTIVMANLGYWQLKAAPGVWTLALAPGRSTEIYTLSGKEEGSDKGPVSKRIIISDFRGVPIRIDVVKKKGMENERILEIEADQDDARTKRKKFKRNKFMKWASNWVGVGKGGKRGTGPDGNKVIREGETINIFSVASGHLYERFLKIMMLSVMKNTDRPVKFWFIKNYLSPQFKDVIPHMAREYGFEYDLVTYKWPSWLHKQTEKQRIIWAYKILFLDVLFPLSLKKVIFVDADQIVRADMAELYDMDIDGKPLAYTPFCDNNKDMDGFRFWNQGFWRDHLRGKPYHISALYVVDLVKFRQSAAGDNLRVFYESLSKDPNSLSNLDQDLPNYAQHQVPIFSLPQQWLWCESWCGNATKAQAKTIDLCNNPMTKEPKLEGARRIVAEWPDLDQEARDFTSRIQGGGSLETPPQPLSSAHIEQVLSSEGHDVERTTNHNAVPGGSSRSSSSSSGVDTESAAEL